MGTVEVLSHKGKGQHLQLSDIVKEPSQQMIDARTVKCRENVPEHASLSALYTSSVQLADHG